MMQNVIIFVVGYFAVLALLSVVARPYRARLQAAIAEVRATTELTERERDFLDHTSETAYSVRVAPMLLLVFMTGLIASVNGIERDADEYECANPNLLNHPLLGEILEMHMVSGAAANPVFGALAYLMLNLWRLKIRLLRGVRGAKEHALTQVLSFGAASRI